MALPLATIDFDLSDIGDIDFDARRTRVYATTNVPGETVVDTLGNKVHIGGTKGTINTDGTGSIAVKAPDAGSNPESWQTYIHVDYADNAHRGKRQVRSYGPFTITADANLADLVAEQDVPPEYAAGILAQMQQLAGIEDTDDAVAYQMEFGSESSTYLAGKINARKAVPASRAVSYGHSYMSGSTTGTGGSSLGVSDMQTLIAASAGLPTKNLAVSGATLHDSASSGDWADLMQAEVRGIAFEPVGGLFINMWGLNDAANIGHTYSELAPYKEALRAVVARQRCAAVFEDTDASVVLGGSGTWSTYTGTNKNSGIGCRYNQTAGGTATITPPADFPGGTIVIGFPVWGDGSSCTWTTTVNGITYTCDTSLVARTGNHPTVALMRIPNVKRTNGAIVLTSSNVSASGAAKSTFDWWGWVPPEDACPVVVLVGQPKPLDYTSQAGAPAGPVTDAGVDVINQIQQEVATEMGSRVLYVDTSAINSSATYWEAGNVHPNALGHAAIATAVGNAIKAAATVVRAPSKDVAPTVSADAWTNYTPALTGITLGSGTILASYCIRSNGSVEFYVKVTLAADSAVTGDVTIALPTAAAAGHTRMGFEVFLFDNGTARYRGGAYLSTTSVATVRSTGTNGVLTALSATAPFTWTTSDAIELGGSYRKAA